MQKISWGIKSLLEKTHAQYIITTIIHLFEINKEDGLLSLAYLLKASFIFPLSSCRTGRDTAAPETTREQHFDVSALHLPSSTEKYQTLVPMHNVCWSGTQWDEVGEGQQRGRRQQHLHSHAASLLLFSSEQGCWSLTVMEEIMNSLFWVWLCDKFALSLRFLSLASHLGSHSCPAVALQPGAAGLCFGLCTPSMRFCWWKPSPEHQAGSWPFLLFLSNALFLDFIHICYPQG